MKKAGELILAILIFIMPTVYVSAKAYEPKPIADVYNEGIYHFESGSGRDLKLQLLTPNKPLTLILIENETKLKYYINFEADNREITILLSSPLKNHTAVMVGPGELKFTFEN